MSAGESADVPSRPTAAIPTLRAATITIYGTFLLLALAIPGSVVGALRDGPDTPVTRAAVAVAERAQAGIEALGIPAVYEAAKTRFRAMSCGGPDSGNPC